MTPPAMNMLPANKDALMLCADAIRLGGLVVFPTDTVYGVGCDPYNVAAIRRIYRAKGRAQAKALPLLLSEASRISDVAQETPEAARLLGAAFWPGALTLVVWRRPGLPPELGGGSTIAVRVPDHAWVREFIGLCGGALATTSANLSGEPDATDARTAASYLGADVEFVVDGGASAGGVPSTVVDCTTRPVRVLRAGAISEQSINNVLDDLRGEDL